MPGQPFTNDGDTQWAGQTDGSALQGGSDASTGSMGQCVADADMESTFEGPGVLSFYYRMFSDTSDEELSVNIDGDSGFDQTGDHDWSQASLILGPGSHTIDWDASYCPKGGENPHAQFWLDQLFYVSGTITPSPTPTLFIPPAPSPTPTPGGPFSLLDRVAFNGQVTAFTRIGNSLYAGGAFTRASDEANGSARVDGSNGAFSGAWPQVLGRVNGVAADGSGGWYLFGLFSAVDQHATSNVGHVYSNGTVDSGFSSQVGGEVKALAFDPASGSLYVGGSFGDVAGNENFPIWRA